MKPKPIAWLSVWVGRALTNSIVLCISYLLSYLFIGFRLHSWKPVKLLKMCGACWRAMGEPPTLKRVAVLLAEEQMWLFARTCFVNPWEFLFAGWCGGRGNRGYCPSFSQPFRVGTWALVHHLWSDPKALLADGATCSRFLPFFTSRDIWWKSLSERQQNMSNP